ncbi:MAG TPA: GNAT family N-acetyltransferase [Anaerolineales bacterium]|nr:GNAT family N-acetyltransferase [Anaerolineales bacterium]
MNPTSSTIDITPYADAHKVAVSDLIVGIQRDEYGLAITAQDQPDLADIPGYYRTGAGNFWVALAEGRVVGTLGLREFAPGQGALRKMFVAPAYRGSFGVAGRLLATLLDWARAQGLSAITLGTTERFLAAHRFYEKNGFTAIPEHALPAGFPRMSVDTRFYTLSLAATIHSFFAADIRARLAEFGALLVRCVADGASIGFLPPLAPAVAEAYWREVALAAEDGRTLVWGALLEGRVVGSVQLALEGRANGTHRAEVAKLMVDPGVRRRGIGLALMRALEAEALARSRTTLVLDTRAGDPSEALYRSLGYQRLGEIPCYARSADGALHATAIHYKVIEP